jgi:hypothetical protein
LSTLRALFDGFGGALVEGAYILTGLAAQLFAQKVAEKIVITVDGRTRARLTAIACF